MKNTILRILVFIGLSLAMLLMPFGKAAAETTGSGIRKTTVKGSSTLVERVQAAPDFHAVAASRGVGVIIGGTDQLVIEANDNLIDYLIVEVERGKLTITIDDKINVRNAHVIVKIPYNGKIDAIQGSSAASIRTEQALKADEMDIRLSSAASLDAALKAERCTIQLSSAAEMKCVGDISTCSITASSAAEMTASLTVHALHANLSSSAELEISGSCETLNAQLSSAAELEAFKFEVRNTAKVTGSSGSSAFVNCAEALTAHASSGASICYKGDCRVDAHKSSGGSVYKR